MNILILSAGVRNKIVQYFKRNTSGKVVATDMQSIAPAIYEADKYYIVPRITEPGYIDVILEICIKEHIDAALSLIDPELSLLAKNIERFSRIGVKIIGSSYELCEMSLNKMKMYRWLCKHGYKCAKSYEDISSFIDDLNAERISFPVFVKPICGSASISISKVYDIKTLELLFKSNNDLMIQEYLEGVEIGADVYVDILSGEVVSIFTKKKLLMRAGETDKAVSIKESSLFDLIEKFTLEAGYKGQLDLDIFDINGDYYISEVNPRFGGGYPHAYESGCNHMKLIVNNINAIKNEKQIGMYEDNIYMMKYPEVIIRKEY